MEASQVSSRGGYAKSSKGSIEISLVDFGVHFDSRPLLTDISFEFHGPSLYVLTGKNGSGKSTLLSVLSGQNAQYTGTMLVNGRKIDARNREGYAIDDVSYLTQDSIVFDDLTIVDNVLLPYAKKDRKKAEEILKKLCLENVLDSQASSLSEGEKQRVAFARLLYDPKPIVLLDEITTALDKDNVAILLKAVAELAENHLVIFVTHEDFVKQLDTQYIEIHIEKEKLVSSSENNKSVAYDMPIKHQKNSLFSFLGTFFKADRFLYLVSFVFGILFTFLIILGDSFSATFRPVLNGYSPVQQAVFRNYIETFPAYSLNRPVAAIRPEADEGTCFSYRGDSFFSSHLDDGTGIGSMVSGVLYVSGREDIDRLHMELADVGDERNRFPSAMGESLISDVCFARLLAQWMKEDSLTEEEAVDRFFSEPFVLDGMASLSPVMTVIGVYRTFGKTEAPEHFLQRTDGKVCDINLRGCYLFGTETLIGISDADISSCLLLATEHNRTIPTIEMVSSGLYSELDGSGYFSPLLLDRDGTAAFDGYSFRAESFTNNLYLLSAFILSLDIVLIASLYVRNRRKFILYRVVGFSRSILNRASIGLFVLYILSGLSIGYVLGSVGVAILDILLTSSTLLPFSGLLVFTPLSFLLPLAVSLCAILLYSAIVLSALCPKDLSRKLLEIRRK